MKRIIGLSVGILIFVAFYSICAAENAIPEFNAKNVNKAKKAVAGKVKISKSANEMLSLLVKYAPDTNFTTSSGLNKDGYNYKGKIGKIVIPGLDVENGKVSKIDIQLEGVQIETELQPVLTQMLGEPTISRNDLIVTMEDGIAKLDGSEYTVNDYNYIEYQWKNSKYLIYLRSNDDAIFTFADGRKKVVNKKQTYVIFSKRM